MLNAYRDHLQERALQGVPPQPLGTDQTSALIELFKSPPSGEEDYIVNLLTERVHAEVDQAAYIKAGFLAVISTGETESPLIFKVYAVEILAKMLGGYNIQPLIACLEDDQLAPSAVKSVSHTLLMRANSNAEYAHTLEIDISEIHELNLCAPNDPDDARLLSSVQGRQIDEVFVGSCMINIGHFCAASKLIETHKGSIPPRMWIAQPTRIDAAQLSEEGYYNIFGGAGARI